MPWLADLVQSSESSLTVLPSQCLCEFLLMKDEKAKPHRRVHGGHERKVCVFSQILETFFAVGFILFCGSSLS